MSTTKGVITAALTLLALTACSVGVQDDDPSATTPSTSADPASSDEATDPGPARSDDTGGGSADDSDVPVVAGYGPGEIPSVPMITMPDLSLLTTAPAAFAADTAQNIGTYPGLSVEPVSCDADGVAQSGSGGLSLYGDGSSYTSSDGTAVAFADDGTGYAIDLDDDTSVTVGPNGSGTVKVGNVIVVVNEDGSGSYSTLGTISKVDLDGEGGGVQQIPNGGSFDTIVINPDGSGSYNPVGGASWTNDGEGGGSYVDTPRGFSITNNGDGTALVMEGIQSWTVDAEPLEPLQPLGSFPSIAALEPRESCGTVITLQSEILFDIDSAEVRPDSDELLESVAQAMQDADIPAATIAGYTDSVLDDAHNLQLSQDRADSVAAVLVELGVTTDLTTIGHGENDPVASNDTAEGRQENRRVETFIPAF